MTDTPKPRSHGMKPVRPTVRPTDLMAERAPRAGVWTARVITLFPNAFPGVLGESLTGRALDDGLWALETFDLRRHGIGRHRNVDDTPAGGGAGLVMRPDVVAAAFDEAMAGAPDDREAWPIIYLSPRGRPFTQARAQALSKGAGVTLLCGRFEGVDQRVLDEYAVEEVSIGDYVLTGGELAAQVLIDATVRLIPRVLGNQASTEDESFSNGLLEHPHYTRPSDWQGRKVPDILLSGHHAQIADWRQARSEALTKERRPDLWRAYRGQRDGDPDGDQEL